MAQAKTIWSHNGERLSKFLAYSALTLSFGFGVGGSLNPGGAKASPIPCDPKITPPQFNNGMSYEVITGDPLLYSCRDVARNRTSTTFSPIPNPVGPLEGTIRYVMYAAKGTCFIDVVLDSDVESPMASLVSKSLYFDPGFTSPIPGFPIFSIDGSSSLPTPIRGNCTTLYVEDNYSTFEVGSGTLLKTITNTFRQTPGPLPVLGAAATFGFSRKLRSRIKDSRTA